MSLKLIQTRLKELRQCGHIRQCNECKTCITESINLYNELVNDINYILDQQGDDLCWMDFYNTLSKWVGREFNPKTLPEGEMLANCKNFVSSIKSGTQYHTESEVCRQKIIKEFGLLHEPNLTLTQLVDLLLDIRAGKV